MCKLRTSSTLTCVLLSPGIGCYLSETTFLQARMMTIPDPVANTACAEETTLMCGRKEKKKGGGEWGGARSIQSRRQHKAKTLQPGFSPARAERKLVGPPPRSRPPGKLADVGSRLPSPSLSAWAALRPAPLSLQDGTHREFAEPGPTPRRGARNQGGSPLASCRPPFPP